MNAILMTDLFKTYWFYEKEGGLSGSLKALFRGKKVFVEAIRGISLNIEVGEVVGFIGPNGAGKTTTLKILSGILYPTRGHVEVLGFCPFKRDKAFLKNITFLTGQRHRLFWDLPAEEYFEFCRVVYEIPKDVYQKNLRDLVELSAVGDILKVPQRKLSFGQRKRCELVGALLHDPKIIFLDEPTNAMDLVNARKLRRFIKEQGRGGKRTIILTSHNMSDIEDVCERIVIINRGKIVFDGGIDALHRIAGFWKRIRVAFDGPWKIDDVRKLGRIKEMNDQQLILEVEPDKTASVASHLFDAFPVKDISITGPGLEKIIESTIYLQNSD